MSNLGLLKQNQQTVSKCELFKTNNKYILHFHRIYYLDEIWLLHFTWLLLVNGIDVTSGLYSSTTLSQHSLYSKFCLLNAFHVAVKDTGHYW